MISSELETLILHHYKSDKWPVGTIGRTLQLHHSVVRRVIERDGGVVVGKPPREGILSPYESFIFDALEKYPHICASRIYQMIKERGYPGSESFVRKRLLRFRPKKTKEAFLRLHMLPGEQAQADWADFGKVKVGRATRRLMGFIIVLSWSRGLYVRFFYSAKTREFLQGFVDAFDYFGAVPRQVLIDNLRSGVTERVGALIRFNERFLKFAGHYGFLPAAANVARGNEKGRVERSVLYVRTNFFAGRTWTSLDDLNSQALRWCKDVALERKWHEDETKLVKDALEEERPKLLPLPPTPFPADERALVSIGKTPYARFDLNDYSVPARFVGCHLEVVADDKIVRIFSGIEQVAEHKRSFDKGALIEDSKHIQDLKQRKRQGKKPSALRRLVSVIPEAEGFIEEMANRQQNIGGVVASLLNMMQVHSECRLRLAIKEAVESQSFKLQAIYFILARLEAHDKDLPPVPIEIDSYAQIMIKPHDLSSYDQLIGLQYDKEHTS